MEGQHTSGNLFPKDVIGQGSECIVIRDYMAGDPAHKSPASRTKLRKSAIMSGERGLRRENFIEASQKKGFYYLIGKRRIVC